MYSEEETELRDLIIQNLENCGFLNKIKAELRAGVFLALEEDGNLKNKIPLFNKKFDDFVANNEGKLILSLVREFLEYFNLHFTLSVFDPEVAVTSCISRSELCEQFKLTSEIDGPVISALMKDKMSETYNKSSVSKSTEEIQVVTNKSLNLAVIESTSNNNVQALSNENDYRKKPQIHTNLEKEQHASHSMEIKEKETISNLSILPKPNSNVMNNASIDKVAISTESTETSEDLSKDILATDHDSFFDEPLPTEKPSFFSFSDTFKGKSESKLTSGINKDLDESKKTSLSSLRDLPSLTGNNEWTFSRDLKSTLPSLDSQKSISSSETSNEEIINLDTKDGFQKKDSDIAESNESSEKQNSEESIEEDIEDFSAGFDDLLNSSLSLGDDITTDQTVSQVSVVEGVDHVEPCK